ncbi:hypothetical protein BGX38DRAFT_1215213 [Terfezia claveryi]|nr:hypothetical protein BGX38DRAFT_1215213 [Terfezia claveryi]
MCRKKKEEKGDRAKKDTNTCNRCGCQGHFANTCFSRKHKDGSALSKDTAAKQQKPTEQKPQQRQDTRQAGGNANASKLCYQCGQEGHLQYFPCR